VDDTDVINFLLSTEIIPLCLRTMEMGSELSKTVATFIVQKILLDDVSGPARGSRAAGGLELLELPQATSAARGLQPRRPRRRAPRRSRRWKPVDPCCPPAGAGLDRALTPRRPCTPQVGLNYICATAERFFAVGAVLGNMVVMLSEQPSPRLLKHIIRCYLRLSDNARAREALRQCLPDLLRNPQFTACLKNDETTRRWAPARRPRQLLPRLEPPAAAAARGAAAPPAQGALVRLVAGPLQGRRARPALGNAFRCGSCSAMLPPLRPPSGGATAAARAGGWRSCSSTWASRTALSSWRTTLCSRRHCRGHEQRRRCWKGGKGGGGRQEAAAMAVMSAIQPGLRGLGLEVG
jgi:hypothetical protein